MGTRGFITFVADGVEKTAYNHWDSYPDSLGAGVLEWLRTERDRADVTETADWLAPIAARVRALRAVRHHDRPTPADIERLEPWTDLGVGSRSRNDWYCLLRGTQGDPAAMLDAGVIEDASHFPADSLFAEWGYVIDLDKQVFEVYEGFQQSPHDKGRFASRKAEDNNYYPVALVQSWPLAELPDSAAFDAAFAESEDEL